MMISFTALLCPLAVLAIIVALIVLIVRSAGRAVSRSAGAGTPPFGGATRLEADGFWLSSFEPASVVYYQFWSAGAKHTGQIAFRPGNDGRQFVYTGIRPDQVEIVRVVGPSGDLMPGRATYLDDDITTPILGAAAAAAVYDSLSNPAPPSPPSFPAAY